MADNAYHTRPSNSWVLPAFAALLLGTVLAWRFAGSAAPPLHDPSVELRPVVARGDLAADELATIELFKRTSPSVVFITSLVGGIKIGTGSGIVWNDKGHIVTNWHVVRKANRLLVTFANHRRIAARFVDRVPSRDLAVLHVDVPKSSLRPILIGSSHDLQVGQKVFAIGNPFGLDQTLTNGIVSALGRTIEATNGQTIQGVIQTNADINPGNSGGALLDSAGRLIGVNTAIKSPTGASAGIGFAIPVDLVNESVTQLIRGGVRAGIGIRFFEDPYLERKLRIPGVVFREVVAGLPAAQNHLEPTRRDPDDDYLYHVGDIITAVNKVRVTNQDDLRRAIEGLPVGTHVDLTVQRKGNQFQVPIELRPLPSQTSPRK